MHARIAYAVLLGTLIADAAVAAHFRGFLTVTLEIPDNIANTLEVTAGQAADIDDPIEMETGFGVVIAAEKATSVISNPPAAGTIEVTAGLIEGIANASGTAFAASLFTSDSFVLTNKSNMSLNFTLPYTYSVDALAEKFFVGPNLSESANLRASFGLLDLINGGGIVPEEADEVIEPRVEPEDPPGAAVAFCNNCTGAFVGTLAAMGDPGGLDRMELVLVGGVQGNAIFLVPEPSSELLLALNISIALLIVCTRGHRTKG